MTPLSCCVANLPAETKLLRISAEAGVNCTVYLSREAPSPIKYKGFQYTKVWETPF